MAGKMKRKPYNPTVDAVPVTLSPVHDRRVSDDDLLRNAQVAVMEVTDPLGLNPCDKIVVLRSLRSDPLAQLHSRRYIDDAQYEGGRGYQRDWEMAERGPRAIDPAKEYVSGGLAPEGITDGQIQAVGRLAAADRDLGRFGSSLTSDVLAGGLSMEEVARRRGLSGRGWEEYFGKRFRECLETLAVIYGQATGPKRRGRGGIGQ